VKHDGWQRLRLFWSNIHTLPAWMTRRLRRRWCRKARLS